jgi:hypothetical protein
MVAIDLPLACWAATAIGTRMGLRPGSKAALSPITSLSALGLTATHTLLAMALLATRPEIRAFGKWGFGLRSLVLAYIVALPVATGLLANYLTRQCYARFDEWADRPRRARSAMPASDAPAGSGPRVLAAASGDVDASLTS